MSKCPWKLVNQRIVIDVTGHPWVADGLEQNEKYTTAHAEDLLKILRPMTENMGSYYSNVRIESDTACRFCGHDWDAACDGEGNPLCCQPAIEMHEANKK